MQQLTQKLRDGEMRITEVPIPIVSPGMVLVRNHYSLISAGTESSTVTTARKSLLGKAKEKPQQVKQVIDTLKQQGVVQTYRAVMKRLEAYSPLGYSCAGEVVDVASDVEGFQVGDKVACAGGNYAVHAEFVVIPKNLCVKLENDTDLQKAAYNTIGAIAMQGVRQARLNLGESCAVIGLGLIGQLTCLLLRASGVKVVGIDINPEIVAIAKEHCADIAFTGNDDSVAEQISLYTKRLGVDAVIITAASKSEGPVNFAGKIARKKARVVVVGAVPTGFERHDYYEKELELCMSCSYGPGRYDTNYEEKGIDYPVGYVRWTENRNMQAFQELIYDNKIDISYLTTHRFDLEKAPEAYELILNKAELYLGIVLQYDTSTPWKREKITVKTTPSEKINVAFIGAGNYAMSFLLPNIPHNKQITRQGILTSSGASSRTVADRFGFAFCTSDEKDIWDNPDVNTVFIATRHNSHGDYVERALQHHKHVFVEKPLCILESQLQNIAALYQQNNQNQFMVGFNRRFSPLIKILQQHISPGPMSLTYRINAGYIPTSHWAQDQEIGGGRIVGEVCHFIDLVTFLNGSLPTKINANCLPDPNNTNDTIQIQLSFANGSIASICYFANGCKSLAKEYLEVFQNGKVAILQDFRYLEIHSQGKIHKKSLTSQDKGQKIMMQKFFDKIHQGGTPLIDFTEIYATTLATFKVQESIQKNQPMDITMETTT